MVSSEVQPYFRTNGSLNSVILYCNQLHIIYFLVDEIDLSQIDHRRPVEHGDSEPDTCHDNTVQPLVDDLLYILLT